MPTVLYEVVRDHLDAWLERQSAEDAAVPRFVVRELRGFLDCGRLERGFVRVYCRTCKDDILVGFS